MLLRNVWDAGDRLVRQNILIVLALTNDMPPAREALGFKQEVGQDNGVRMYACLYRCTTPFTTTPANTAAVRQELTN